MLGVFPNAEELTADKDLARGRGIGKNAGRISKILKAGRLVRR